jgi:hypothetical protein
MNRRLLLWLLILTGPIIWFANLEANFAVAGWVCAWRSRLVLAVISAVALAVVAASGLVAWREHYGLQRQADAPVTGSPALRVMAIGGAILSAMFFVVILAQVVPTIFLDGCQ